MIKPSARGAPNVPHEFLGQARLFCSRIDAAAKAASAVARQIATDAHAIAQRRPTWRPEHLPGFERQWRHRMPDDGLIALEIERSKRTLTIAELRLARASYEDVRWSQSSPEDCVVLALRTFRFITPAGLEHQRIAIAGLGIHAIARRYQRGWDNTDAAIQADIAELPLHAARLDDVDSQTFSIPCLSGVWVGAIEVIRISSGPDQRVLNVRSFLNKEK
jgi:hypothetical protein